jgi:hypothetical protein
VDRSTDEELTSRSHRTDCRPIVVAAEVDRHSAVFVVEHDDEFEVGTERFEIVLGVAVDRPVAHARYGAPGVSAIASVVSDDSALVASPISVTMFFAARTTSGSASKAARPRWTMSAASPVAATMSSSRRRSSFTARSEHAHVAGAERLDDADDHVPVRAQIGQRRPPWAR